MKTVIVGNGIAGNQTAFLLREYSSDMEISIVSAENFPEYDPCAIPYFIGNQVPRNTVFRKDFKDYKNKNINLVLDSKVVSIDPSSKKIITDKGKKITYDNLVLAHGGSLFIPPIKGMDKKGVLSCKQLGQADKLAKHKGSEAVVIGSGAIGIEVAESLKNKGYSVCIIELVDWILPALFDKPAAKCLENSLQDYGVKVFTGEKVLCIKGNTKVESVLTDNKEIFCDTVVIATGVVSGKELAKTAGIETNQGIKVDSTMKTNIEGIYACGDCVETFDAFTGKPCMYQLKHNAIEQAEIVAKNISGKFSQYQGAYCLARVHFFKTHAVTFGKIAKSMEPDKSNLEIIEKKENENYLRIIIKDGRIVGGQAIGSYADLTGLFMSAMWKKLDINNLRKNWLYPINSKYTWTYHKIGLILGF